MFHNLAPYALLIFLVLILLGKAAWMVISRIAKRDMEGWKP